MFTIYKYGIPTLTNKVIVVEIYCVLCCITYLWTDYLMIDLLLISLLEIRFQFLLFLIIHLVFIKFLCLPNVVFI